MPNYGPGNTLYHVETATASASFSPQEPYAARVLSVRVGDASADDVWLLSVNGQEVGVYGVYHMANNNLLGVAANATPYVRDIFSYCRAVLGRELTYSVPQGQTLKVSSIGGATADVAIEYEEVPNNTLGTTLVNHPQGSRWLAPVYLSIAAPVAAPGDVSFDTEVGLSFVPKLFLGTPFQQGWSASILALFGLGEAVNTYDSAADHISQTEYIAATINGQTMFTREDTGGIPLIGWGAATGSANNSLESLVSPLTSFIYSPPIDPDTIGLPLMIRPGYNCKWRVGITGDTTGGADYSLLTIIALVEYVEQQ